MKVSGTQSWDLTVSLAPPPEMSNIWHSHKKLFVASEIVARKKTLRRGDLRCSARFR
jgi:hypothetical protein